MVSKNQCHNDSSPLARRATGLRREVSGRVFTATIPAMGCSEYDERIYDYGDAQAFNLAVAKTLANEGPVDGASFAFMRTVLSLKGTDLAALLDVTSVTISKWENGKTLPPRAAWLMLSQMVLDEAAGKASLRERLEALTRNRPPKKHVGLDAARGHSDPTTGPHEREPARSRAGLQRRPRKADAPIDEWSNHARAHGRPTPRSAFARRPAAAAAWCQRLC